MSPTRNLRHSIELLDELVRKADDLGIEVWSASAGQDAAVIYLETEADAWRLAARVQSGIASQRTTATACRLGVVLRDVVAPGDVHTAILEVRGMDRRAQRSTGPEPVPSPA